MNLSQAKSPFQEISYNADNQLLEVVWINTDQLTEELYKKEILWQLNHIQALKPKNLFIDTSCFNYTISPEVQDWSNTEILPIALANIKKIALLIPADLFAQVSIEQQIEDNPDAMQITQYFQDKGKAITWLLA